jgi:hypothetical protein
MQKHAVTGLSPEWQRHFKELHELPRLKYRRERDEVIWSWIGWLLILQHSGALSFDLRTCSLGANPSNENARPSELLLSLTAIVAREYPDSNVTPRRLYDAIRHWRKSVSTIEE